MQMYKNKSYLHISVNVTYDATQYIKYIPGLTNAYLYLV